MECEATTTAGGIAPPVEDHEMGNRRGALTLTRICLTHQTLLKHDFPEQPQGPWWENMTWPKLEYKKGQINRAGHTLISLPKDDPARTDAIMIVDNWRACHSYPLQAVKMALLSRAKKIDSSALIAQRLKRRPSIEIKLRDNPNMKLSQMQDIAGCRAVMPTVADVRKLVRMYERSRAKGRKDRSEWDGSKDFDYIENPKVDGYRGVHLICRYGSASARHQVYAGQRIEVQIRTRLQHLWATAVETAQVFTGQALKSRIKRASTDWLRYFALVSGALALREKCKPVPGIPTNRRVLIRELRKIAKRERIMDILDGWSESIHFLEEKEVRRAHSYLLVLNPSKHLLSVTPFGREEVDKAEEAYKLAENANELDANIQVVLVSVESVDSLKKAYPNYYADTREFILAVRREMTDGGSQRRTV